METPLVATGSKWTPLNGRPLFPGDLINNWACYDVHPDYKDQFWRLPALYAEKLTTDSSRTKWMYPTKVMYYTPMTGGWETWRNAQRFLPKVLENSRRLSKKFLADGSRIENKNDELFFSVQKLSNVIDPEIMGGDVMAVNVRNQEQEARETAWRLSKTDGPLKDAYIVVPALGEFPMRTFAKTHSLSRGISPEDLVWEVHKWGRFALFEATHGLQGGASAWSRSAALEKATGVAIEYGAPIPLAVRDGESFTFIDDHGRSVSIFDQAQEDARHLVYELTKVYKYNGREYRARSETSAALLLSRFMHDEMYRNGPGVENGGLDKDRASDVVKAHYAAPEEMAKFDKLRDTMLPFLANYCNWPTLQEILKRDPALQKYWDEHVAPAASRLRPEADIKHEILRYLPRGGFETPELNQYVEERRDPPSIAVDFNLTDMPDMPDGLHEEGFNSKFDPKLFNDRNFARLGRNSHPDNTPDPDHLSFEQGASISVLAGLRHDGIPPFSRPHRVLYLDNVKSGYAASAYMEQHGVDSAAEMNTKFDALAAGGSTYAESVAKEAAADMKDRVRELGLSPRYEDWRARNRIGLVDSLSDISAALSYTGRREAMNAEWHESIAADGSMHLSGEALETVVRRLVDLEETGVVLLPGAMDELDARLMIEALLVAFGQSPRPFSGGKYRMQFFMDFDYWKPPQYRREPVKLDLADMIIHLGVQVKARLEQPNPETARGLYVSMARLLDLYERVLDPARRNKVTSRDPRSGKDTKADILDLHQVDPSLIRFMAHDQRLPDYVEGGDMIERSKNPEYDAFFNDPAYVAFAAPEAGKPENFYDGLWDDPVKKAQLVKRIWGWMRAETIRLDNGKLWPVPGNLNFRGIRSFDKADLKDLHSDYDKGFRAWHTLNARERANIFHQQQLLVETPSVRR